LGRNLITAANAAAARALLNAAGFLGSPASQTAMLALTGNVGDCCYRTDQAVFYDLTAEPASSLSNWTQRGIGTTTSLDGGTPTGVDLDGGTPVSAGSGTTINGGTP
jgi:hypothetical protein